MESNEYITKVVDNIRILLIEQYLNYDDNNPLKSMEAALTGDYDNKKEIERRVNIVVDLDDDQMNQVTEEEYYLCKNRLTKFTRIGGQSSRNCSEERMGYLYMLMRKSDVVCCKWKYVDDSGDKTNNKEYEWMEWNVMAANWITYTVPGCQLEGFVYGSLMEY
jgi:hypothetical protein